MLADNFRELLLCPAQTPHEYDGRFADTNLFIHQCLRPEVLQRRVDRLRSVFLQGQAVGISFYFEGDDEQGYSLISKSRDEVISDASRVLGTALGKHVVHLMLVWFKTCSQPPSEPIAQPWQRVASRLSFMQFTPTQRNGMNCYHDLAAADKAALKECLLSRADCLGLHESWPKTVYLQPRKFDDDDKTEWVDGAPI